MAVVARQWLPFRMVADFRRVKGGFFEPAAMMNLVRRNWLDAAGIFLGVAIAILVAPFFTETGHYFQDLYDVYNPPAKAKLAESSRPTADSLHFRLLVTRNRDCSVSRLIAFTGDSPTRLYPANTVRRVDGESPVDYPLGVTVLSRLWLVQPTYGHHLLLVGHYDCRDRMVRAVLLNERIP